MSQLKHECYIGLYNSYENSNLITLEALKDCVEFDWQIYQYGIAIGETGKTPPYKLSDYLDKRKNTNLYRFNYCPICGREIDWKQLRQDNK